MPEIKTRSANTCEAEAPGLRERNKVSGLALSHPLIWEPEAVPLSLPAAMETTNGTETWLEKLHTVLKALNSTLHGNLLCQLDPGTNNLVKEPRASQPGRDDNSYMYILFVMFLFAATVGSLILGYTRSRKVDKRSDPYHVYIKNRVSMI